MGLLFIMLLAARERVLRRENRRKLRLIFEVPLDEMRLSARR